MIIKKLELQLCPLNISSRDKKEVPFPEVTTVSNQTAQVSFDSFQQKLDAFKTKIALQQMLTQSLSAEFESLNSEFESLKQQFDASLSKIESTSADFDATSNLNDSTSENFDSSSGEIDTTSFKSDSSSIDFDSTLFQDGATDPDFESLPEKGATSSSARELAALIRRSARESLKICYSQPNIPDRMAEIILALKAKKRLSVAEMRQITGASRITLVRDLKILKLLGWLQFHGSRKKGYFTLTAPFPDLPILKEANKLG
jgi:hypothetical protein